MAIIEALAQDHRTLEIRLSELSDTAGSDPARRVAVFSSLQALVQAHARAEEEVVYRRLREREPEEQDTLEAYEEHHVADILLQELASACPGGLAWSAKTKVLEELLRHHIKAEELNLFPMIQQDFDDEARALMAREFQTLKHEQLEAWLGRLRRVTPAFAGRAAITMQAAAGRLARRGELKLRRAWSRLRA